jgi:uncharacterized protein YndB with AHSA1/START domain
VPDKKLVFTDAFSSDWVPKAEGKPFMIAIVTFEDDGGQTRYTARVRHWTKEDIRLPNQRSPERVVWQLAAKYEIELVSKKGTP